MDSNNIDCKITPKSFSERKCLNLFSGGGKINFIILFCSIMHFVSSYGQKTVRENVIWNYEWIGCRQFVGENYCEGDYGYRFEGTETLVGREYCVFRDAEGTPIAYMREDRSKVYLYLEEEWREPYPGESQGPELLLYDFEAKPGDCYESGGFPDLGRGWFKSWIPFTVRVEDISKVTVGGEERVCQTVRAILDGRDDSTTYKVVEGIGMISGILPFPQYGNYTSGMRWDIAYLDEVTDNDGNVLYNNPYPKPPLSSVTNTECSPASRIETYDVLGIHCGNVGNGCNVIIETYGNIRRKRIVSSK